MLFKIIKTVNRWSKEDEADEIVKKAKKKRKRAIRRFDELIDQSKRELEGVQRLSKTILETSISEWTLLSESFQKSKLDKVIEKLQVGYRAISFEPILQIQAHFTTSKIPLETIEKPDYTPPSLISTLLSIDKPHYALPTLVSSPLISGPVMFPKWGDLGGGSEVDEYLDEAKDFKRDVKAGIAKLRQRETELLEISLRVKETNDLFVFFDNALKSRLIALKTTSLSKNEEDDCVEMSCLLVASMLQIMGTPIIDQNGRLAQMNAALITDLEHVQNNCRDMAR